jgi:rare lipoprotein A
MFLSGTGATPAPAAPAAPIGVVEIGGGFAAQQPPTAAPRRELIHLRSAALNVLAGHPAIATGSLWPHLAGAGVRLQLLFGRRWVTVARAFTGAKGRFEMHYVPHRTGSWLAQVRYGGVGEVRETRRIGVLSAFRAADASWYGGGGGLACGGELTSSTIGVANKTLPCGTWLTLRYDDRNMRVQVIDRGPYVAGREFDLTEATKRALGFEGVGVVWTTS